MEYRLISEEEYKRLILKTYQPDEYMPFFNALPKIDIEELREVCELVEFLADTIYDCGCDNNAGEHNAGCVLAKNKSILNNLKKGE